MVAAHAVVADHHRLALRIQCSEMLGDAAHGRELRARDMATLEFPDLAHIEQIRGFALRVVQPGLELDGLDLLHR